MTIKHPFGAYGTGRAAPRLNIAVDAVFIGLDGNQKVTILDLSQTGAKVAFQDSPRDTAGFIKWLGFETFGDVVRREGLYVGLQFDRPIPVRWLRETHDRSDPIDEHEHLALMRAAKEWVEG